MRTYSVTSRNCASAAALVSVRIDLGNGHHVLEDGYGIFLETVGVAAGQSEAGQETAAPDPKRGQTIAEQRVVIRQQKRKGERFVEEPGKHTVPEPKKRRRVAGRRKILPGVLMDKREPGIVLGPGPDRADCTTKQPL